MKALAVIPTIFESPFLGSLIATLSATDTEVLVVNNDPELPRMKLRTWADGCKYTLLYRKWGIYRTWNFGLRCGAIVGCPVLVLNDDIILHRSSINRMLDALRQGDWAILGFDYGPPRHGSGPFEVSGSYRTGGVGGFAFGCNPRQCTRVDRRFIWWGGDDDLFLSTANRGGKVGILRGATVEHPIPSLTANARPDLLPEGWAANDRAVLRERHGTTW